MIRFVKLAAVVLALLCLGPLSYGTGKSRVIPSGAFSGHGKVADARATVLRLAAMAVSELEDRSGQADRSAAVMGAVAGEDRNDGDDVLAEVASRTAPCCESFIAAFTEDQIRGPRFSVLPLQTGPPRA